MRSPFDYPGDSSWWAVHGASRSDSPPTDIELERNDGRDTGDSGDEVSVDVPDDLALRERIAACERETVKDLALVRAAAAMMNEAQPTA
ncbi:MAG: hypothetical protein KF795_29465 [Labilithrix sp.]|nr:hypothetical protein [Labilithrix sp.]